MHAPDGPPPLPPGGPDRAPLSGAAAWALGAAVGRAELPALREELGALVRGSRAAVVICDVSAITDPDADTIDVLAHLQLTARRLGCGIRLHRAQRRLRDLLVYTGLGDVLPLHGGPAVEPGQAGRRERGIAVEELVDPPDPAG